LLSQSAGRISAAIFQQLDDPRGFLYLGEWTSQAAFESAVEAVRRPEAEAALFESEPRVHCCQILRPFSGPVSQAAAVGCTIIEGPDAAAGSLLRALSAAGPAGPGVPRGMVGYALYQDLAAPGRIILIHGWLAAADLEEVQHTRAPEVIAALQALGASVTYFAARSQVVLGATLDAI
jgi:quinol monooxygenase YgiN